MSNVKCGTVIDLDYLEDEYLDQKDFVSNFTSQYSPAGSSDETSWEDCYEQ